jgi:membrane protease YdiL (CAAX protease family)
MHALEAILVVLYSLMLWYDVRTGLTEYAAFKLLTETSARQRYYKHWLLRSFLFFSGSALIGLMILGRWRALLSLPGEFSGISQALRRAVPDLLSSRQFLFAFGGAVCVGVVLGGVIAAKLADRGRSLMVGDVEPLMPRNLPETGHTLLLSLNAGLGEELLFRLFLPLLLASLSGNAVFALIASALVFGVMHVYQGPLGVVITTFLGFALTAIYLGTGRIWIAVAVHAGIDIVGLVVRPTIVRVLRARQANAPV